MTLDGITFTGSGSAPTLNGGFEADTSESLVTSTGPIAVGDRFEVTFTATIDPDVTGTSSSGLENQATSTGTGINPDTGLPDPSLAASDASDNGVDPTGENGEDDMDGTFGNDPTPIVIADIAVAKSTVGIPTELPNGNFEVVYQVIIENNGNVDLAGLTVVEDLAGQFDTALINADTLTLATPPANASSIIALNSNWDGDSVTDFIDGSVATLLAAGDSFVVEFTVEVDPDAVGAPANLENQVTANGDAVDENGNAILDSNMMAITATDDSDSGTDPNGENPNDQGDHGTSDDPTPLLIPDIGVAKIASDAVPNGDNFDVTFTLVVENIGTCLLYTSPSPRDQRGSRMPSSA